jgi:hypothetical protein
MTRLTCSARARCKMKIMGMGLTIPVLLFCHVQAAQAQLTAPTVDANQEVVRLGADVDQALGIWNSEFELYEVDSYSRFIC